MNAQRIDIGKSQWIALRDGLFIHVRTRRRWCLEIHVAPRERVRLLARSALPLHAHDHSPKTTFHAASSK